MDRNKEFVKKLSGIEQEKIILTIEKILAGQTNNLDVKKTIRPSRFIPIANRLNKDYLYIKPS